MIPILFPADATTFTTQGLGALSGAISCIVNEVANGEYELEMEYPVSGIHFEEIQKETIIYQIPSPYRAAQPFRVYKIEKKMDGVATIYAHHISYDLRGIPIRPFSAASAVETMSKLENYAMKECPFSFSTDKTVESTFFLKVPTACRSMLGGISGSILDVYGGEYLFDGFSVKLLTNRGSDNGVTIRYGKNLTDMVGEEDALNYVTGIVPYWAMEDVVVYGDIQWKDGAEQGRAVPKDFTDSFGTEPTVEDLETVAKAYVDKLEDPRVSIEVAFENLAQMSGYEGLELLEKCDLFDVVTVQYGSMGVNVKAKIVEIETDALLEKYKSVTVGNEAASIAQTIVDQKKELQEKTSESRLQQTVNAATAALTGTLGGNFRLLTDDNGHPTGFVIMDTDDVNTAQKVWRYNLAGWGVSQNGINGPYEMAATLESGIVADVITAGTMLADRILGGTLTLGGASNAKGVLSVLDGDGNELGRWDNTGIQVVGTGSETSTSLTRSGATFKRTYNNTEYVGRAGSDGVRVQQNGYMVGWLGNGFLQLGYEGMTDIPIYLDGKTGNAAFSGTVTQGSDRRLKTDIQDLPDGLVQALFDLAPKLYRLRLDPGKTSVGLIAQEVQGTPLEDVLVVQRENGLLHLDYTSLHGLVLGALQSLDKRLRALEQKEE